MSKESEAMPKETKEKKRPTEAVGNADTSRMAAFSVDFPADDGKDKAAQSLGQRGGWARAKALSATRRRQIAQKAAAARWKN
jgi:hypothetical protein